MYNFGPFEFDAAPGILRRGDEESVLPPKAAHVLQLLLENPGQLVTKDHLIEVVWADAHVTESALTDAISLLRRLLDDDRRDPIYIQTLHRRGYRFIAQIERPPGSGDSGPAVGAASAVRARRTVGFAAGVGLGAIAVVAGAAWYAALPDARAVHSSIAVEAGLRLSGGHFREGENRAFQRPSGTAMALSPDGNHLAYIGTRIDATVADGDGARQLYMRTMGPDRAVPMAGTDGASTPFFSPDGEWVGFIADGLLQKVAAAGGEPVTVLTGLEAALEPLGYNRAVGAIWGEDGTIVVGAHRGGLLSGPATGGALAPLTTLDVDRGESSHRLPHMLPGGGAVLFTVARTEGDWERAEVAAYSLASHQRTTLISGASDARYVSTGHLLFAREGTLMAVRFDPERLEVLGDPIPVIDDLLHSIDHGQWFLNTGTAHFTVSDTGTLAYAPGGAYPEVSMSVLRVDASGEPEPVGLPWARYISARLSPDGKRLLYSRGPGRRLDVWTYNLERGTHDKMTSDGLNNSIAIWSPDGQWIAFGSDRDGAERNLYVMAADRSGEPRRLTTSDREQRISSWSVDGTIAFLQDDDIWVLENALDPDSEPHPFFESAATEAYPTFSPDGKWLAYTSDRSGQQELYVRPYPGPDPPTAVTGDAELPQVFGPAWAPDGGELYFRRQNPRLYATRMAYGATLEPGPTRVVFTRRGYSNWFPVRDYDVDPAGGFIMISRPDPDQPTQPVTRLNVVFNWFAELTENVPAGGGQ